MFRVILRISVTGGIADEFEQTWRQVAAGIARQPANLNQWLLRSTTDSSVYFVVSDWRDEASFREFEHSEAHRHNRQRLGRYHSGLQMETTTAVWQVAGEGAAAR